MTTQRSSSSKKLSLDIDANGFAAIIKSAYEITHPDINRLKALADTCNNHAQAIEQAVKNAWVNNTKLDRKTLLEKCELTLSHLQAMACMNGLTLLNLAHQYTRIAMPTSRTETLHLWRAFFEMTKLHNYESTSHQMQLIYTTTSLTAASTLLVQFANAKTLAPPDPDYYTRMHTMRLVFVRTVQMIALNNSTLLETLDAITKHAERTNQEGQL